MNTAEPIRELEELERFKNYYAYEKPNIRNYTLLCIGLNTALRISDMLMLRWGDVYDFEKISKSYTAQRAKNRETLKYLHE